MEDKNKVIRKRLYTSVLLVLMAFVAITAATVAWFSIADKTKVKTMSLDIAADTDLRMDLDAHAKISQYVKTLSFQDIAKRMQSEKGFSMENTPLEPVTTADQNTFTYEDGTVVPDTKGAYLTFTLHFMAEKDMVVHLSSANKDDKTEDGTSITSTISSLPDSMRISFTTDGMTWVYDHGMGDSRSVSGTTATFGLPNRALMKLNDNNAMFSLKEGVDKPVLVHIWMEGTDPACTDELKTADYAIKMRFVGEKTEDPASKKPASKKSSTKKSTTKGKKVSK